MAKWIDRSHPQVTTGAVILGYIAAFSALIGSSHLLVGRGLRFILPVVFVAGAVGTANNKKIGHLVLGIAAIAEVALQVADLALLDGAVDQRVVLSLGVVNSMVFSVALLFAVFHRQTMEYRRIWFE